MEQVTERTASTMRFSESSRDLLDKFKARMGKSWNEVVEFILRDYDKLQEEHRQTQHKLRETERLLSRLQGRVDSFVIALGELRDVASSK